MTHPLDSMKAGAVLSTSQPRRALNRSDLFPQLITMQKRLKASSFAVFRIVGSGPPSRRKLVCELENFGADAARVCEGFLAAYGHALIEHIDNSLLPLIWSGSSAGSFVEAPEFGALVVRLPAGLVPFSGIAYPVRLGATGNGFVIFTAKGLDLACDDIIEHHMESCRLMTELLSMDERRTPHAETLSEREIACLQLAGDGRISEEIAEKLGLSVHTVNAYLGSAAIKLNSVNRIQAIAKAIRLGYIH